jgi:hypothetical protein
VPVGILRPDVAALPLPTEYCDGAARDSVTTIRTIG